LAGSDEVTKKMQKPNIDKLINKDDDEKRTQMPCSSKGIQTCIPEINISSYKNNKL